MLYITVKLYGKNGILGEFREYETRALRIFRQHAGEVLVAYVPGREPGNADIPDEIQILRIENRARLDEFMQDPERIKMSAERERVIRKTELYISEEIVSYPE